MHNLKEIRKDFENFKNLLQKRNVDINFDQLKKLDVQNRDLIQKKESYENEKKNYQSLRIKVCLKNQKKFLINYI